MIALRVSITQAIRTKKCIQGLLCEGHGKGQRSVIMSGKVVSTCFALVPAGGGRLRELLGGGTMQAKS